jgi:hypothetical protein
LADLRHSGRLHAARNSVGACPAVFHARPGARANHHQARVDPKVQTGSPCCGARRLRAGDWVLSLDTCDAALSRRTLGNLPRLGCAPRVARARPVCSRQWNLCCGHARFLGNWTVRWSDQILTEVRGPGLECRRARGKFTEAKLAGCDRSIDVAITNSHFRCPVYMRFLRSENSGRNQLSQRALLLRSATGTVSCVVVAWNADCNEGWRFLYARGSMGWKFLLRRDANDRL